VDDLWKIVTSENIKEISDIKGYHDEFLQLFGFSFDEIDYDADTNELVAVPSIEE